MSDVLKIGSSPEVRIFYCPGCKCHHQVPVTGPKAWGWNGSMDKPTFTPSILVSYEPDPRPDRPSRCHSHVRGGQIQFLSDCTHWLAGQTVPLTADNA